jgi:hypothetical protein
VKLFEMNHFDELPSREDSKNYDGLLIPCLFHEEETKSMIVDRLSYRCHKCGIFGITANLEEDIKRNFNK